MKEHQDKTTKSAKYIQYFASFTLVYSEEHLSRSAAMKREMATKEMDQGKEGSFNCRQ